jgi:RHS repeat-associated protein
VKNSAPTSAAAPPPWACPAPATAKVHRKRAGHETGLDYFGAWYYASTHGRFTGADPYDINFERQETFNPDKAAAVFGNYLKQPQHWNHYIYTLNSPLKYVDPDGLMEYETELLGQNQGEDFGQP